MEYRKLISFGKNSFVVSLPKSWIRQNKMQKGDLIHIADSGSDLILSKKESEEKKLEKTKVILVDGKPLTQIEKEINSAYILNYRTIILKGEEVRGNIRTFQNFFQNLIALEVMEQTPTTLVAKDFLHMDKVSADELIRKMDIVTRTMLKESCTNFSEENYKGINERDKDVNRLYFLLYRSVLFNLDNPLRAITNFKLNSIDLVNILFSGYYLEGMADEVRRTARYCRLLEINAEKKKEVEDLLARTNTYYLETMRAFYGRNVKKALELSAMKKDLNEKLDVLEQDNRSVMYYSSAVSRMRRMISFIHNLGRNVYQGYNYFDISGDPEGLLQEKQ
ncbi:MAG: phosphate uptake regulator PhoU [Nanoarchaeota archaeon]|nr:phosphate uptake regulator PhoU [Nanoarchaeota archaeon]